MQLPNNRFAEELASGDIAVTQTPPGGLREHGRGASASRGF